MKNTLAAIGCTGHQAERFIEDFLSRGIKLRILARNPAAVTARYPQAEIIEGSLMNPEDVARAMIDSDAAFVMTPMCKRNKASSESNAGLAIIEGAKIAQLKHFIYTSALCVDKPTGVGVLDAKHEIERSIVESGIPYSTLRCGPYMQDVFDTRLEAMNKGRFLFPLNKHCRFCYVAQQDVSRFVIEELLSKNRILNHTLDLVSPGTFSLSEVEVILSEISGFKVKVANRFPAFYIYLLLKPFFYLNNHKFSTIIPLAQYFDKHGCVAGGPTVGDLFPDFRMTTLQDHLRTLWPE